jgi:hypothetical protein
MGLIVADRGDVLLNENALERDFLAEQPGEVGS